MKYFLLTLGLVIGGLGLWAYRLDEGIRGDEISYRVGSGIFEWSDLWDVGVHSVSTFNRSLTKEEMMVVFKHDPWKEIKK